MLTIASVMEILMIVCFVVAWALNIAKAWKARTAKGTSVLFYFFILIGCVLAIVGKFILIAYYAPQKWWVTVKWYVLAFYFISAVMVLIGILVYYRNKALDKIAERKAAKAKQ